MSTRAADGRNLNAVLARIRQEIASSYYREGGFIPSTRELAEQFGVSAETIRRGLKQLEREGVLESRPRSGFRMASTEAASLSRPIAFVTDNAADLSDAQPATWALSLAFQGATASRGWSLLGAHSGERDAGAVVEQIRGGNAWGVIVDSIDEKFTADVTAAGVPAVMVNSWVEDRAVDVVIQDNYRGGFLAADHLVEAGARRVAWIGSTSEFCHSRERFAGAGAALSRHGMRIADEHVLSPGSEVSAEAVAGLLRGKVQPDGLLAFGPTGLVAVIEAAGNLGMTIGKDFQVIGWVVEECYELHYRPLFERGRVAPAVVWSAREMAERAVGLLAERSAGAGRRPLRACIATAIRTEMREPREARR